MTHCAHSPLLQVDYNFNFRLYITTKIANPNYTPEVSTKVRALCLLPLVPDDAPGGARAAAGASE